VNWDEYLARIGSGGREFGTGREDLKVLQRGHLLNVPFENLDIHWKRQIVLEIEKFYEKIVGRRRGGFCYELNGLFNELLRHLGFKTRMISARVFNGTVHGPEFDHAAIIVTIGEDEYLADVGFADFTAEPLRFAVDEEQVDPNGTFVIRRFDAATFEVAKRDGESWNSQYVFKDIARDLSEFAEMCNFQQYSPESLFTKGKICSVMTETGRKSLTDTKYIVAANHLRAETPVGTEADFNAILDREFDIRQNI